MSTAERTGIDRRHFLAGAAAVASASLVPNLPAAGASPARSKPADPFHAPDVPLYDLEVWQAAELIRRRHLSPVELAQATLDRIEAVEPAIGSFANLYPAEEVLAQAQQAADEIARRRYRGPLHGITVGLKDIYLTEGKVTKETPTCTEDSCLRSTPPRWCA